jgi:hypothetical protein
MLKLSSSFSVSRKFTVKWNCALYFSPQKARNERNWNPCVFLRVCNASKSFEEGLNQVEDWVLKMTQKGNLAINATPEHSEAIIKRAEVIQCIPDNTQIPREVESTISTPKWSEYAKIQMFYIFRTVTRQVTVNGRDFDGRQRRNPSRYRPVESFLKASTERVGYSSLEPVEPARRAWRTALLVCCGCLCQAIGNLGGPPDKFYAFNS